MKKTKPSKRPALPRTRVQTKGIKDDPERLAALATRVAARPQLKRLRALLVSLGGDEIVARDEPHLLEILERGQLIVTDDKNYSEQLGRPSECHANVADIYAEMLADAPDLMDFEIMTGWALSNDGLWRQHTWGLRGGLTEGKVVETTERRLAYFGFILDDEEAFDFCELNPS